MSKKNKFKKHNKNFVVDNAIKSHGSEEKKQESPKEKQTPKNEYNMKADFLNLSIIIILIIGAMAGLYYYDKQSGALENVAQWLANLM